jgi:hypothetical protein
MAAGQGPRLREHDGSVEALKHLLWEFAANVNSCMRCFRLHSDMKLLLCEDRCGPRTDRCSVILGFFWRACVGVYQLQVRAQMMHMIVHSLGVVLACQCHSVFLYMTIIEAQLRWRLLYFGRQHPIAYATLCTVQSDRATIDRPSSVEKARWASTQSPPAALHASSCVRLWPCSMGDLLL